MIDPKPLVAVLTLSTSSLLAQAVQDPGLLETAGRMTLTMALVVAVGVLWRTLSAKDAQVVAMSQAVATALTAATDSNRELRKIMDASVEANQELARAIETMKVELRLRPCMQPDELTGTAMVEPSPRLLRSGSARGGD